MILRITTFLAQILPTPVKQVLYRFDILARMIRRVLNLATPTGLTETTIAAGPLRGCRMLLDMHIEKDYWLGTYEIKLQNAVEDLVKPGWVAYDLGANIGYISMILAKAVGEHGKVIAFEGLPANVERLISNLALNGLNSRVQVVHGAVGNTSTPVDFLVGPSGGMGKAEGSAGRNMEYKRRIEVPGVRLDEYIYQHGNPIPQMIKMDIEGGEVLALPGMLQVLSEARPLVFMELHGREAAASAWEILSMAEYQIARMEKGYPRVAALSQLDWKAYLVAFP
jgi:FkbM family methyltransferase